MRTLSVVAVVALAMCAPASGENCGALKLMSSFDLVQIPGSAAQYIPVEIAGVPKLLQLDTSAGVTIMTGETATALGLKSRRNFTLPDIARRNEYGMSGSYVGNRVYGANGSYSDAFAIAPLVLGRMQKDNVRFMIAPEGEKYGDDPRVAGALGADILQRFDLSIDFAGHTLALVDQDHCKGNVVYWPATAVAAVPFDLLTSGRIVVEVALDGRQVKAVLDSGATNSVLYRRPAEGFFNLTMGSADTPEAGNFNGEAGSTVWRHTFKSLTLEGITVANPQFTIEPNRVKRHIEKPQTGSLIEIKNQDEVEPDMLLGMNVLRSLHVYIAYRERMLYITPSAAPPSK